MQMFSIFDSKADGYLPPFLAANGEVAKRMVLQAASDPSHTFATFAGDYTLFGIGLWHEEQGFLEMFEAFENHGTVLSLIAGSAAPPITPLHIAEEGEK